MSDFNFGGWLKPGDIQATARGCCPLDGFPLVEFAAQPPLIEGGWEHVIPAEWVSRSSEALQRIAEAHASEARAAR